MLIQHKQVTLREENSGKFMVKGKGISFRGRAIYYNSFQWHIKTQSFIQKKKKKFSGIYFRLKPKAVTLISSLNLEGNK